MPAGAQKLPKEQTDVEIIKVKSDTSLEVSMGVLGGQRKGANTGGGISGLNAENWPRGYQGVCNAQGLPHSQRTRKAPLPEGCVSWAVMLER